MMDIPDDCASFEASLEEADLCADVLEWLREHEPWRYSTVADEILCFFCGMSDGKGHVQSCIWKRAQASE